ncbi:EAL domain-containing protein [Aeromonas veronii]|uniref:putative bifunctional diguanylate cyclase/phosphodiesterase n=1 Tax=Aeromonas TaxID=642 RepID=UPI001318E5F4|nr:GGDEF domain-containing phosphodiesterase [Aeromonas veronii]QHC07498.1 EAL domain-containing protein [Aeromonas veronii]
MPCIVLINQFVEQQARIEFLAQRANQYSQNAALHLLLLLQTDERYKRVALYTAMDSALAASDAAIEGLERAASMGGDVGDIDQLINLRKHYGDSFQQTVERIEIDGLSSARQHYEEQTDVLLKALLVQTLRIAEHQQELMQSGVIALKDDANRARLTVIILAFSALVTGSVLALLIARSIAKPVHKAVMVAEAIAGGDYQCKVPLGLGVETKALMRALDTMRRSISTREQHILRLAYADPLTELPNRTCFMEALTEAALQGSGALVLIDIDRFAQINNALGHLVGDRLLQEMAQRLLAMVAGKHLVARLGGDEFALLIKEVDYFNILDNAQELLGQLRKPIELDGQRLDVEGSLGIAIFPEDGNNSSLLMRRAGMAMRHAKRRRDGFAFACKIADESPHEQLALIGEMRDALINEEFVAFFQPKLELASGLVKGAEALLRWQHPTKGLVPPGRFIPFAEQTGFIREITPWLLAHVICQAASWHREGHDIVTSVNLSTLDLTSPDLVPKVIKSLQENTLPAQLLCLEVTESALMDDPDIALQHLKELASLGVKLSIDDYGSGQASLAYVKNLPVHELKIDRIFVSGVDQHFRNAAIVRSTILLCQELGLSVVAEGAETQEELAWLRANHCDTVQGYVVAKPMPAEEFAGWVTVHHTQNREDGIFPHTVELYTEQK